MEEKKPIKTDAPVKKPVKKKRDPCAKLHKPAKMLVLQSSPHFNTLDSVPKIMWSVILALVPAFSALCISSEFRLFA